MVWTLWLCGILLVAAFTIDIQTRKIPNYVTVTVMLVGIFGHWATEGWQGLLFSGFGVMGGFGMMLVLFLIQAVGAGDVKLFAGMGACMGVSFTWETFVYAILYGGFIAAGILLLGGRGRWRQFGIFMKQLLWFRSWTPVESIAEQQATFPFMWAVMPAAVTVYWGQL